MTRDRAKWLLILLLLAGATPVPTCASPASRQKSLAEWRVFTASNHPPPRVFVKGNNIRFYWSTGSGVEGFKADWQRLRVPAPHYEVNSAVLKWDSRLPTMPQPDKAWREASVIAGPAWQALARNLVADLAPSEPLHALIYQAFLANGVIYRDKDGVVCQAAKGKEPPDLIIDQCYTIDETLDRLAQCVDERLATTPSGQDLFLLMPPDGPRFTQPLLLDRHRKECVWLTPAALYDPTEGGFGIDGTAKNLGSLVFESHGIALIKNPVSSAARLADLGLQTGLRILRRPVPRAKPALPPAGSKPPMDLAQWEKWLSQYTGTRPQPASLDLLIDGNGFFPRFSEAVAAASNHIHLAVYIFDRDDIAIGLADQLRLRSKEIPVRMVLDRLGSLGAGMLAAGSPTEPGFVPPASLMAHLREDSEVQAHYFLNPWFSSEHSKTFLIDGQLAWLGGMNVGREYRYEWHDVMVELRGPIVASLEKDFRRQFAHAGPLGDLAYASRLLQPFRPPAYPAGDWVPARLLPTRTFWKPFSEAVLASLRKAGNHIFIEHPYLFDKRVLTSLVEARRRGVDVRVVLPRVNDLKAGGRSNLVTANYLLGHGIRVYFYPGMTHVKAVLVDGWSCLGSANLNHLGMRLCQEQNVATSDPAFATRVRQEIFEKDFAASYELTEPLSVNYVDFLADLIL